MTRSFVTAALVAVLGLVASHHQPSLGAAGPEADPHAYFKALVARPDHIVSYSLRDPRQLAQRKDGGFTHSNSRDIAVSYDPKSDRYPRKQDAAKVVIPADGNSLRNQVRLPFDHRKQGFLVTWDAWLSDGFAYEKAGIRNYKAFQLESGGRIWTEIRSRFQRATRFRGAVALVDVRPYGPSAERKGSKVDGTNYGGGSLGGLRANFPVAPNTWTRYWVQLTPRPDGEWWDFSLWVADENRDAVLLYDREGVKPNGTGWDRFWIEYNTSTSKVKADRGELVSYVRNVVVLAAVNDPDRLLERPVAGASAAGPSTPPAATAAPENQRDTATKRRGKRSGSDPDQDKP